MEQPRDQMRFSIVVPAYNEAAYLGCALDSLLHQDYNGRYEVIVVDNNSTDGTAAIAAWYGVPVVKESQQGVCRWLQCHGLPRNSLPISASSLAGDSSSPSPPARMGQVAG